MLRKSDLSPVNYKRVAEKDGREVPWDQIVKGYEYDKGKYVVLKNEDLSSKQMLWYSFLRRTKTALRRSLSDYRRAH